MTNRQRYRAKGIITFCNYYSRTFLRERRTREEKKTTSSNVEKCSFFLLLLHMYELDGGKPKTNNNKNEVLKITNRNVIVLGKTGG